MSGNSGKGSAPSEGGGGGVPGVKRSASIRRLSTEAAELALHLDGIDLADLEEAVDEDQEEAGGEGADQVGAPKSNASDISAEVAELTTEPDLNDRWAAAAPCPAPSDSRASSRRSSRSQQERQRDELSESRAAASAASGPQRRTSTHTFASDANRSAGSLFSTGSHGSFGFGSGDPAIIGVLKGTSEEEDDSNNKGSPDGEGDAGAGIRSHLPRHASTRSVGSIDLGAFDYVEDESIDAAAVQDKSVTAGTVVMPSRGFNTSATREEVAPPSPTRPRRQTPPARYDPEAIGKILGPDDDDDAEEAAWSQLGKYERSIGFKPGHNRRGSDYAEGADADADFEKQWGDMVAVSGVGCGRGRFNAHTLRVACGVLAFVAAAVAVGIGTFAGVEHLVSSGGGVDTPTPIAEMSEEDRIQGALPTPTPPEPPSNLADVCSVESFSSDPSSERSCREACTAAECCFLDVELNAALSCKDDHPETCQQYVSFCAALDSEQQ